MNTDNKEKNGIEELINEMTKNQNDLQRIDDEKEKLLAKKEVISKKIQEKKKEIVQHYTEKVNKVSYEHNIRVKKAQKVYLEEREKIEEEYLKGMEDKMAEKKEYMNNLKSYSKDSAIALFTQNEIERLDEELRTYKLNEGAKYIKLLEQIKQERNEVFEESKKITKETIEESRKVLAMYGIKTPEIKFKDEIDKENINKEEKAKKNNEQKPKEEKPINEKNEKSEPKTLSIIYSSREQYEQEKKQAKEEKKVKTAEQNSSPENEKNNNDEVNENKQDCHINIKYNAKKDSYYVVNSVNGEKTKIPRKKIRTYGEKENQEVIEKSGIENEFIKDVDCNIFQVLLVYDKENGTNKAKEYKQYILSGMESDEFLVTYDLKGLYSKNSKISKQDKQKLLETAEYAKKARTGKVKTGFRTRIMSVVNRIKNYDADLEFEEEMKAEQENETKNSEKNNEKSKESKKTWINRIRTTTGEPDKTFKKSKTKNKYRELDDELEEEK